MSSFSSPTSRRYQDPNGLYQLPNDAPELERLDAQSAAIVNLMNKKPFRAPLVNPKRILDIGCGTGVMTSLLASLYPDAQVIGVDIAAVQNGRHPEQPNLEYVQGDIRELLKSGTDPKFREGSFDYVYSRLLILGMVDWPGYIRSAASLLKPTGWLEIQETTMRSALNSFVPDADDWLFYPALIQDARAIGLDLEVGSRLMGMFHETGGLEDVQQTRYEFPPAARPDKPELDGLCAPLEDLIAGLLRKVCSKRSEAELDKLEQGLHSVWKTGFNDGDHFGFYAVIGRKSCS